MGLSEAPASGNDHCPTPTLLPITNDKPAKQERKFDLIDFMTSIDCFMRVLRITDVYNEPVDLPIYATRNKVNLLVSWLLPGLYGLLGACVYVMRELLRGNGSGLAGADPRIADLLSLVLVLVLRVALGALAGIIIGWFSVPNTPAASSAAISISSLPFGMAFLAGFSIETLFSWLDRLNKTIGQRDEKVPAAAAAKEPEVKA